jgi:hypothetical protein
VHLADFICIVLAAYAGKHLRADIEINADKYNF